MSEVVFESVRWMAEALCTKRLSSTELVKAHLDQIAKVNPKLNAVVEVGIESALAAARLADQMVARGQSMGPLHGVPMTVKGAWDCAGFINSGGSVGRKGQVAAADATVIARMRAAGAIPLGSTNLPEFSFGFESDNLIYGRSNNPYDLQCTPGGSGGGGSAAIASGCSPFEVGGDMGGSIRVPCHCCGIAGLKPTLGRVPLSGYFPGPFGPVTMFATAGPMARFVDDLFPLLKLMAGPDMLDANAVDGLLRDPALVDVAMLRIAFHSGNGVLEPAPEVDRTVTAAARFLNAVEAMPEGMEECYEIFMGILGADGAEGLTALAAMAETAQLSPLVSGMKEILKAYAVSGAEFARLLVRRDLFRSRVAGFFQRYDALLCPVNAYPAMPHGKSLENLPSYSYTMAHNLSGCPAAVVRFGSTAGGLPIGVQIVAAPWREDIALAVASQLEKNGAGFMRPRLL